MLCLLKEIYWGAVETILKYYWRVFCCDLKEIFNEYYFPNVLSTENGKWQ
jgi:hypothetical protein